MDRVRVFTRGGTGGQGTKRFGLGGGDGGDVVVVASTAVTSLRHVLQTSRRFLAPAGHAAVQRTTKQPQKAADLMIRVPLGTIIHDEQGNCIGDLNSAGQTCVVARGGDGGGPMTSEQVSVHATAAPRQKQYSRTTHTYAGIECTGSSQWVFLCFFVSLFLCFFTQKRSIHSSNRGVFFFCCCFGITSTSVPSACCPRVWYARFALLINSTPG